MDTFGLERITFVGTDLYLAPEQRSGSAVLNPPVDVYGVGCILFELSEGTKMCNYSSQMVHSCELRQTLEKLLNSDPEVRFSGGWEEIKKLPLFRGIEWDDPGKMNTTIIEQLFAKNCADVQQKKT